MTLPAQGTVNIACASEKDAEAILGAIAADDDLHSASRREGLRVIVELQGRDVMSLLRACDDLLACVSVAEDVIKKP